MRKDMWTLFFRYEKSTSRYFIVLLRALLSAYTYSDVFEFFAKKRKPVEFRV